jgi:HEAT repeat protein
VSAIAGAAALERAGGDDFQEFWEIVECMGEEGWESAIAAWEAADARRSETKAEREQCAAEENRGSAAASDETTCEPAFAGGIADVTRLKKVENLSPDGKPAIPVLLELLQDRDERVRFLAASVLGGIGPDAESAVPGLTDLLMDESRAVRRVAAKALKKIETEKK